MYGLRPVCCGSCLNIGHAAAPIMGVGVGEEPAVAVGTGPHVDVAVGIGVLVGVSVVVGVDVGVTVGVGVASSSTCETFRLTVSPSGGMSTACTFTVQSPACGSSIRYNSYVSPFA